MALNSVTMTTTQTGKFPRVGRSCLRSAICTSYGAKDFEKQILPGIGTYVIDSPKDQNSRVRQQCIRYQESHRGILRARIDALPDIPKRCGMRSVPIVQLRDRHDVATSPANFDSNASPQVPSPDVRIDQLEGKHRKTDRTSHLRRQDSSGKLLTQEELVPRSPIGRMIHNPAFAKRTPPRAGFGVRNRGVNGSPTFRKEYTNLSVNVELSEPGPAPYKATDRELMSQAEYRKQLTFYISHMNGDEGRGDNDDNGDDARSDLDTCRSLIINMPADNVGHTSKYNIWASNLRLGEVLSNNATPDLKRKLAGSRNDKSKSSPLVKQYSQPYKDKGDVDDDDDDDMDYDEEWLHVVNTPVVDRGVYDRYANVKLSFSRLQSRSRTGK